MWNMLSQWLLSKLYLHWQANSSAQVTNTRKWWQLLAWKRGSPALRKQKALGQIASCTWNASLVADLSAITFYCSRRQRNEWSVWTAYRSIHKWNPVLEGSFFPMTTVWRIAFIRYIFLLLPCSKQVIGQEIEQILHMNEVPRQRCLGVDGQMTNIARRVACCKRALNYQSTSY